MMQVIVRYTDSVTSKADVSNSTLRDWKKRGLVVHHTLSKKV